MRTLIIAMGLAAIAAGPVLAQQGSNVARGTAAARTNPQGTTGTRVETNTTLPSTSVGAEAVLTAPATSQSAAQANANNGVAQGGGNGFGTNIQTNPNAAANATNPFSPNGSFSNDSGNSALGTSAGQSSSGTAAGNSSEGIPTLGNGLVTGTTVIPDDATVSTIGGSTGGGVVGVPAATQNQQATIAGSVRTPLFDQAAREGRAKESARRARGDEPRIYGIAPNTERDLTHQMPDDRIIRY